MATPLPQGPFKARVIASYDPVEQKEIALLAGSVINVLRTHSSGWWKGEYNGRTGWFPSTFVKRIDGAAGEAIGAGTSSANVISLATPTGSQGASSAAPDSTPAPKLGANKPTKPKGFIDTVRAMFRPKPKARPAARPAAAAAAAVGRTPVFGRTMLEVVQREKDPSGIPVFLDRGLTYLWAEGFGTEGLFRVPCLKSALDQLAASIDNDSTNVKFEEGFNVALCGGVIKQFLRQLPEPFFPASMYRTLMDLSQYSDPAERMSRTVAYLTDARVAECNLRFFLRFVAFLHEAVTNHVATMKMTAEGYGTVFGPGFFTDDVGNAAGINLADMGTHIQQLVWFITTWPEVAVAMGCNLAGEFPAGLGPTRNAPAAAAAAAAPAAAAGPDVVVALYDYEAQDTSADSKHISLVAGERLVVERRVESGWLKGYKEADPAIRGWFPSTFVAPAE